MPRDGLQDPQILPAYDTKRLKTLHHDLILPTVPKQPFKLALLQDDTAGSTTGTTLWLGGQVLAAYLLSLKKPSLKHAGKPKAIDLGSGIGYTALLLAASGYDVVATDLPILTDGVLASNMTSHRKQLASISGSGCLECLALDWTTEPRDWPLGLQEQNYDIIFSSDSIYQPQLVKPLLQTILSLSTATVNGSASSPDIYIAYEHRDDAQYSSFTQQAEVMGFKVRIVPKGKVGKAVTSLYGWKSEAYEGITVLYLKLLNNQRNGQ